MQAANYTLEKITMNKQANKPVTPEVPTVPEVLTPRQEIAKAFGASLLTLGRAVTKAYDKAEKVGADYWVTLGKKVAIDGFDFPEFEMFNSGLTDGKNPDSGKYRAYKSIIKSAITAKVSLLGDDGKLRSKGDVTKATKAAQDKVKSDEAARVAAEAAKSQDTTGEAPSGPVEQHTEAASTKVTAAFALLFDNASLRAQFASDVAKVAEMIVADAKVKAETKAQRKARQAAEKAEHDANVQADADAASKVYADELASLGLTREPAEMAA